MKNGDFNPKLFDKIDTFSIVSARQSCIDKCYKETSYPKGLYYEAAPNSQDAIADFDTFCRCDAAKQVYDQYGTLMTRYQAIVTDLGVPDAGEIGIFLKNIQPHNIVIMGDGRRYLYRECKQLLEALYHLLDDPKTIKHHKVQALSLLLPKLIVCADGIYTDVQNAISLLTGVTFAQTFLNIASDFVCQQLSTHRHFVWAVRELDAFHTHVVSTYIARACIGDFMPGLYQADDSMIESLSQNLPEHMVELFRQTIRETFTLEIVVDRLVAHLDETVRGICSDARRGYEAIKQTNDFLAAFFGQSPDEFRNIAVYMVWDQAFVDPFAHVYYQDLILSYLASHQGLNHEKMVQIEKSAGKQSSPHHLMRLGTHYFVRVGDQYQTLADVACHTPQYIEPILKSITSSVRPSVLTYLLNCYLINLANPSDPLKVLKTVRGCWPKYGPKSGGPRPGFIPLSLLVYCYDPLAERYSQGPAYFLSDITFGEKAYISYQKVLCHQYVHEFQDNVPALLEQIGSSESETVGQFLSILLSMPLSSLNEGDKQVLATLIQRQLDQHHGEPSSELQYLSLLLALPDCRTYEIYACLSRLHRRFNGDIKFFMAVGSCFRCDSHGSEAKLASVADMASILLDSFHRTYKNSAMPESLRVSIDIALACIYVIGAYYASLQELRGRLFDVLAKDQHIRLVDDEQILNFYFLQLFFFKSDETLNLMRTWFADPQHYFHSSIRGDMIHLRLILSGMQKECASMVRRMYGTLETLPESISSQLALGLNRADVYKLYDLGTALQDRARFQEDATTILRYFPQDSYVLMRFFLLFQHAYNEATRLILIRLLLAAGQAAMPENAAFSSSSLCEYAKFLLCLYDFKLLSDRNMHDLVYQMDYTSADYVEALNILLTRDCVEQFLFPAGLNILSYHIHPNYRLLLFTQTGIRYLLSFDPIQVWWSVVAGSISTPEGRERLVYWCKQFDGLALLESALRACVSLGHESMLLPLFELPQRYLFKLIELGAFDLRTALQLSRLQVLLLFRRQYQLLDKLLYRLRSCNRLSDLLVSVSTLHLIPNYHADVLLQSDINFVVTSIMYRNITSFLLQCMLPASPHLMGEIIGRYAPLLPEDGALDLVKVFRKTRIRDQYERYLFDAVLTRCKHKCVAEDRKLPVFQVLFFSHYWQPRHIELFDLLSPDYQDAFICEYSVMLGERYWHGVLYHPNMLDTRVVDKAIYRVLQVNKAAYNAFMSPFLRLKAVVGSVIYRALSADLLALMDARNMERAISRLGKVSPGGVLALLKPIYAGCSGHTDWQKFDALVTYFSNQMSARELVSILNQMQEIAHFPGFFMPYLLVLSPDVRKKLFDAHGPVTCANCYFSSLQQALESIQNLSGEQYTYVWGQLMAQAMEVVGDQPKARARFVGIVLTVLSKFKRDGVLFEPWLRDLCRFRKGMCSSDHVSGIYEIGSILYDLARPVFGGLRACYDQAVIAIGGEAAARREALLAERDRCLQQKSTGFVQVFVPGAVFFPSFARQQSFVHQAGAFQGDIGPQ